MINGAQEKAYLTVGLYERSFGTEASGDFTLPDYQSEIRRILHVAQTVLPPAKYIGADAVEFNGTVDYQVIYVGMDGGMYSVPLSTEYSFNVPLERSAELVDGVTVLCNVCAESVNTRVSAPRRLSIRSRLRPNVRIYGRVPTVSEIASEVNPMSIYRRSGTCMSLDCEYATSDIINVTYNVPKTTDDIRVVSADAKVVISSQSVSENGIDCRGNVLVNMLTATEGAGDDVEWKSLKGEIPFEGEIDTQNYMTGADSRIRGVLSELSVSVGEDGIECNAGIILEAVVCSNGEVEYTDDVYSTEAECECVMKQVEPRAAIVCSNMSFTVSERIPLSSTSIPASAEIIDSMGYVCIDKCAESNGKYVFSGTASFVVFYRDGGDIYSADVSVPVRFETEGSANLPIACFDACADATNIRARISDGSLCIDAELIMSADCFGATVVDMVDRVTFGEPVPPFDAEIVVCYPTEGDTLWSVAKKYKVPTTSVIGSPENDRFVIIE